jgi:hypothetical protein
MSTRDIEAHLRELYGVDIGRDLISRVTDAVMDDVRACARLPSNRRPALGTADTCSGATRSSGQAESRDPQPSSPPGERTAARFAAASSSAQLWSSPRLMPGANSTRALWPRLRCAAPGGPSA